MRISTVIFSMLALISFPLATARAESSRGDLISKRILGGQFGDLWRGAFAFIYAQNDTDAVSCSGLLVGPSQILTAAHCVAGEGSDGFDAQDYTVIVAGEAHSVVSAVYNSMYVPTSNGTLDDIRYDLGVLTLGDVVTDVAPIPILEDLPVLTGEPATVFGYGDNELAGTGPDAIGTHAGKFGAISIAAVKDGLLFQTYQSSAGVTICPGDSGGGLLQDIFGYDVVIGSVSSGNADDSNDQCSADSNTFSIFVDLQSATSQAFLHSIDGIEFISGKSIVLSGSLPPLIKIINSIMLRKNIVNVHTTLVGVISKLKRLQQFADAKRLRLLVNSISELTAAEGPRATPQVKQFLSKGVTVLGQIVALGVS